MKIIKVIVVFEDRTETVLVAGRNGLEHEQRQVDAADRTKAALGRMEGRQEETLAANIEEGQDLRRHAALDTEADILEGN